MRRRGAYPTRTYPHGDEKLAALDGDRFARLFDATQKVVVYWQTSAGVVSVVGYYSTRSAARAAATANAKANGDKPIVEVNWNHTDITHVASGPVQHPDATVDLPAWVD